MLSDHTNHSMEETSDDWSIYNSPMLQAKFFPRNVD